MTFQLTTAIREARTFLLVPGNRPDRFTKAMASAADVVVFDLEDSVPPQDKVSARVAVADALPALCERRATAIRVNALGSSVGQDDIEWLASSGKEVAVMVPKSDNSAQLVAVHARLPGCPLLPLIESADGYAALNEIAGVHGVERLVLGTVDFMVDLGMQCDTQETQLTPLRFATALASRRFGLSAPVDGVTVDIADGERLRQDTLRALDTAINFLPPARAGGELGQQLARQSFGRPSAQLRPHCVGPVQRRVAPTPVLTTSEPASHE